MSDLSVFSHPFSRAYWKAAAKELHTTRSLVAVALLLAVRVALKTVFIPLGDNLNIYFGFLANAVSGAIGGPFLALLSGAVGDLIGWLIAPQGAFNPVFTLIEMGGALIYSLFLYRAPVSVSRLFLTKLTVNVVINIACEPLALSVMYGKGILVYVIPRVVKNLILLPVETAMLAAFFAALMTPLVRLDFFTQSRNKLKLSWVKILMLSLLAATVLAVAVFWYPPINTAVKDFLKLVFHV